MAIRDRECEVTGVPGAYIGGTEPRLAVLDIPMLTPAGDQDLYREIYRELRETYFKEIWAEWNIRELASSFWGAQQIWLKPEVGFLENWDSLNGVRIRSYGAELPDLFTLLGAIPVPIAFGEVYTSLATGLVDGLITSVDGGYQMGFFEITKNMSMIFALPAFTCPYAVNLDAWNELPADLQDTITNYVEERREWYETGLFMVDGLAIQLALIKHTVTFKPVPPDFRQEIVEASYEAIWKPWLDRAGPEGAEAFNEVAKIIIAKGYEVPGYTVK
jgi:TRAP-type C4-dicarboxylate transport system substrate-binding protein